MAVDPQAVARLCTTPAPLREPVWSTPPDRDGTSEMGSSGVAIRLDLSLPVLPLPSLRCAFLVPENCASAVLGVLRLEHAPGLGQPALPPP